MQDDDFSGGAVLPLESGTMAAAPSNPWELLWNGGGTLVEWAPFDRGVGGPWSPALSATSELAQQLTTIATRAGAAPAVLNGQALFTLALPTGSTLKSLVPAVGGGFRGMTRTAGTISGHVRLVPVAGLGVGAGAGLALGPLVALMGLAVGAEMLGRHQQDAKLQRIYEAVVRAERVDEERTDAQLKSAEEALAQGRAALLDRISIPSSVGLGAARNNLRDIRNRAVQWLDEWERALKLLPSDEKADVDLDVLDPVLRGRSGTVANFPKRIAILYQALCLDSRAHVLTSIESALANPDVRMHNLEAEVRKGLEANASNQDRLLELLWRLAERPVGTSFFSRPSSALEADRLSLTLSRLAEAAARLPDAPAVLGESGNQIIELLRSPEGVLRVLGPGEMSAAST